MLKNPNLEIEIQGYVCCLEDSEEGFDYGTGQFELSFQRALSVYNYLAAKGIDENRMRYKGYGASKLVPELTEDDRTMNRRVEIKVLKN